MQKVKLWFTGLSRVAQVSVLSAAALGGFMVADAATPPSSEVHLKPSSAAVSEAVTPPAPVVTTVVETETQAIPFNKVTKETAALAQGVTQIETAGKNGVTTLTHTITRTDGVETGRTTASATTSAPVDEVTLVGTYVAPKASCDENYSGCVPIVSYDLDCGDIGFSVVVRGYDKHRFDGDKDGYGCESY